MRLGAVLLVLLLAGCSEAPAERGGSTLDVPLHGVPDVHHSNVEVQQTQAGLWRATRTTTIANDIFGAVTVYLSVDAFRQDVHAASTDTPGYTLEATLFGEGATEEQARAALESMQVHHEDDLQGDALGLTMRVESQRVQVGPLDLGLFPARRGGSIEAHLPTGPDHNVALSTGSGDVETTMLVGVKHTLSTGSGDVHAKGLSSGSIQVGTGSGDIRVEDTVTDSLAVGTGSGDIEAKDVRWAYLEAGTGSGDVVLSGMMGNLSVRTGSGDVELDGTLTGGGAVELHTASGDVQVHLQATSDHGLDVSGRSSSGKITIEIPDGQRLDDGSSQQFQQVRSRHYDAATWHTVIAASTGSGDVDVGAHTAQP